MRIVIELKTTATVLDVHQLSTELLDEKSELVESISLEGAV